MKTYSNCQYRRFTIKVLTRKQANVNLDANVYHLVEVFLDHVSVLVVAEGLFDVESHQVESDALVQPAVRPFLSRDKTAVILVK